MIILLCFVEVIAFSALVLVIRGELGRRKEIKNQKNG